MIPPSASGDGENLDVVRTTVAEPALIPGEGQLLQDITSLQSQLSAVNRRQDELMQLVGVLRERRGSVVSVSFSAVENLWLIVQSAGLWNQQFQQGKLEGNRPLPIVVVCTPQSNRLTCCPITALYPDNPSPSQESTPLPLLTVRSLFSPPTSPSSARFTIERDT